MKFARVLGTVIAAHKYEGLDGVKLLVVQPLNDARQPEGLPQVAADATAQAGPGHLVFMVASREAAQALPTVFVPVDLAVTGIVDDIDDDRGPHPGGPSATWHGPTGAGA